MAPNRIQVSFRLDRKNKTGTKVSKIYVSSNYDLISKVLKFKKKKGLRPDRKWKQIPKLNFIF